MSKSQTPSSGQKLIIPSTANAMRLDRWLHNTYPELSFNVWSRLMRKGQVRLNGKRVKGNERLQGGEELRLPPEAVLKPLMTSVEDRPTHKTPIKLTEDIRYFFKHAILFENDDFMALNKPSGLAVQGGTGTHKHLDGMLQAYSHETGIIYRLVHRLDRDTSGVILIAKTEQAARELTKAFQQHSMHKFYVAITMGVPQIHSGKIDQSLAKKTEEGKSQEKMHAVSTGNKAVTLYEVLEHAGSKAALMGLSPLTGRTHQLRAHLNHIGTPILGDGKYGGATAHLPDFDKVVHLHAFGIAVPGAKKFTFITAPLSPHLVESAGRLGFNIKNLAGQMHDFFGKFYSI